MDKFLNTREVIGRYLRDTREEKGISLYRVSKSSGLRFETIKSIESGEKNYSIDSLLAYIGAIDVYFFFSPKEQEPGDKLQEIIGE